MSDMRIKEGSVYHKIETLWERDTEGSKKLIEGSFRNETVGYLANLIWIGTEKVDGTNIRIIWDGHSIMTAGRTNKSEIPKPLADYLRELFGDIATEELFEQMFGEKEVVLYGEGYGAGIQKVGAKYSSTPKFILFDVKINDVYLSRTNVEMIAKNLGLDVVPIVFTGTLYAAAEYVKSHPKSKLGDVEMEGIVCRPALELLDHRGERLIVKIKSRDMKELV